VPVNFLVIGRPEDNSELMRRMKSRGLIRHRFAGIAIADRWPCA
jgi:hypothetical protein